MEEIVALEEPFLEQQEAEAQPIPDHAYVFARNHAVNFAGDDVARGALELSQASYSEQLDQWAS